MFSTRIDSSGVELCDELGSGGDRCKSDKMADIRVSSLLLLSSEFMHQARKQFSVCNYSPAVVTTVSDENQ